MAPRRQPITSYTAGRTVTLVGEATSAIDTGAGGAGVALSVATATNLAAPVLASATPSLTGGTLAAGTYYYKVSATTASGESVASNEVSAVTTGLTSSVALAWSSVGAATGYRIYAGTAAGAENRLVAAVSEVTTTYTAGQNIPTHVVVRLKKASALMSRGWIIPGNAIYPRKSYVGIRLSKPSPRYLNAKERRTAGA